MRWNVEKPQYKVEISLHARQMLSFHIQFVTQVNPDAARRTKERIISAVRSLEQMPERHPFFNEEFIPTNKYHKMFVDKWYLVLYQVKDQTVYVDYVIDCRQDYGWLL